MKKNTQFKKYLGIIVVVLLLCVLFPLWNGAGDNGDNVSGNVGAGQGIQDGQDSQSGQVGQDTQGSQSGQVGQDTQGSQSGQDGQDTQGSQSGQVGQDTQGSQSGQDGQDTQGSQSGQDGQDTQGSQFAQDGQDIWEGHGTQDDIDHPDVVEQSYTFRNEKYLEEHFEKHGSEFDYATKEEYVEGANRVIASEEALYKTEAEDGDHIYYLESSNEIVFLSTDGYIRTYFKPQAGKKYYDRQ